MNHTAHLDLACVQEPLCAGCGTGARQAHGLGDLCVREPSVALEQLGDGLVYVVHERLGSSKGKIFIPDCLADDDVESLFMIL